MNGYEIKSHVAQTDDNGKLRSEMVIANDERVEAVADAKFSPVIGRGQWRGLKQRFSKLGLGNVERSSVESRPNGGKGIVVLVVGRLDACPHRISDCGGQRQEATLPTSQTSASLVSVIFRDAAQIAITRKR